MLNLLGLPLSVLEPLNTGPDQPVQKPENKHAQKPNGIVFPRRRALYGRPVLNARGEVRFGLKHDRTWLSHESRPRLTATDALNRFSSADSLAQTVHLMKSVFPKQFGLHNVFTSDGSPFRRGITTGIDEETPKIPKRLRGRPVELVQRLQRRSRHCSYAELLRYYCPEESTGPWKLGPLSQSDSDSKSSASQPLITQPKLTEAPLSPETNPDDPGRPTIPPPKPTLIDHATPASSVSAFCRAVLQKLIPPRFFGTGQHGLSNKRTILKRVDQFIRMRRFESLNLHEVCQGLKITSIPWLEPPKVSPSSKLSQTDLQKRTELLHEFIYYLFDSILIPLIRTNFYVTESQTHRNRLFFFRHDIWRRLTEEPLTDLKSSVFEELKPDTAQRVLGRRPLGYSSLRLLPKTTGVRPILNLRRRTWMKRDWPGRQGFYLGPSINSTVTPIYNMLNYERTRGPEALGSSLFSMGDIHPRLKEFKERIQQQHTGNPSPPLYFVKLDIQSCFDTIPQQKLIRLIEELVSEESYHITKHVELRPSDEFSTWTQPEPSRPSKAQRRFVGRAAPATKPQSLPDAFASGATSRRRNTVFVDTLAQREYNSEDLLDMLDEHVRNNLVRIGKKYFRQRNGIPQGSVLSSILCNYFYAELEREVLQCFLSPDDSLLLRLVDDFLLITSNANAATYFLTTMVRGQPDYGISVNPSKSLTNFTAAVDGIHIPQLEDSSQSFPYCGNLINTRTLDISRDQDRILDGGDGDTAAETLSNALTVESARNPGRALHRKMLAGFKLHMHPMYLDTMHNSRAAVLGNLYTNFVTSAMKTYRYLKALGGRAGSVSAVVIRIIQDITLLAVRLCRSQRETPHPHPHPPPHSNQHSAPPTGSTSGISDIPHSTIQHLCATAFRFVLCRKQTRYAGVLRWLEMVGKTTRPRSNAAVGKIARVVRLGNERFGGWRF